MQTLALTDEFMDQEKKLSKLESQNAALMIENVRLKDEVDDSRRINLSVGEIRPREDSYQGKASNDLSENGNKPS